MTSLVRDIASVGRMARIKFTMTLPAVLYQEGPFYVGCMPNLDVSSQGKDRDEALKNLIEAAQLFIESCYERNVLDEVLKNLGFEPTDDPEGAAISVVEDSSVSRDREHLNVPVELLLASHNVASSANY